MFHSTRMGESEIVRKKKSRYFERDLFVEKLSKKISKLPFFFCNLILMKANVQNYLYLLLAPIVLTSSFEKFKPLWNPSLDTLDEASITNTRSRPLLSFKLIILPLVSMPSVGFDLLHPLWLSWLQVYSINVSITFLRRKIAVELISLKRFSNSSEKKYINQKFFIAV